MEKRVLLKIYFEAWPRLKIFKFYPALVSKNLDDNQIDLVKFCMVFTFEIINTNLS